MRSFSQWICRYAGAVSVVGSSIGFFGAWMSVFLYQHLRTDIEELLPESARSVQDINHVRQRLQVLDNMVVLVFSEDTQASQRFVEALAGRLSAAPKDIIAAIEYRIDQEVTFFKQRQSLYIDIQDLKRVRSFVREKIDYETELYNPLTIFSSDSRDEPAFDIDAMRHKYESKVSNYTHFPDGYYATADKKVRAMVVFLGGKGLDAALKTRAYVDEAIKALGHPGCDVKFTGNAQNMIEESAALVEDLELSTGIVVVIVTGAMLLFFRSLFATFALVGSLFMGTFWTFGVARFLVGYLNANTAFLASIVIGNGINFGIIIVARYLEERRKGKVHEESVYQALHGSVLATAGAALAAGFSYGSLMLTHFRGFSQFGVIGLLGMGLCWLSSVTLLPAYLTLFVRLRPEWVPCQVRTPFFSRFSAFILEKFPFLIAGCAGLALVLSCVCIKQHMKGSVLETAWAHIETDLSKLRDTRCMKKGSGALYHYIDDIFKHSFSPMVIMLKTDEHQKQVALLLRKEKEKTTNIGDISMLDDFVPQDQLEKIRILKSIRGLLPERLLARLSQTDQEMVHELLSDTAMKPFVMHEMPDLLLRRFREKSGALGHMVLVDKAFSRDGTDDAFAIAQFVTTGRRIADSVEPGAPVAGDLPISYDMFQAILEDGPKATLVAFLSVSLLVGVLFWRTVISSFFVLGSLFYGVLLMIAGLMFFDVKINFLNFIALPITFGIGVDYAFNIFHRYREEKNILEVVRSTGGAVILSSFTTVTGYGSLLLAGNQAFVSFGKLAVLGEVTCVFAAVIALPACIVLYKKYV